MAKVKHKREILDPAVKGTVSRSVLTAKAGSIPRVITTDVKAGDRVLIVVLGTREKIAGDVIAVTGQGQARMIRVANAGDSRSGHREFRIADCRITKIGRSGTRKATLGFLKGGYTKPGVQVGQVFRSTSRVRKNSTNGSK